MSKTAQQLRGELETAYIKGDWQAYERIQREYWAALTGEEVQGRREYITEGDAEYSDYHSLRTA